MASLKGRDLRGITDVNSDEIKEILEVSKLLKNELKMGRAHRLLEGKTTAGIFETPSTRTATSFEVAMTHFGGKMLFRDRSSSGSETRAKRTGTTRSRPWTAT